MSVWYPFDVYDAVERPLIVRALGCRLYDGAGRSWLDMISSWWVSVHGHCHPRLVAAVQAQAAQMDQIIYAGLTHRLAEELAAKLVALYPGSQKVFYSDDGSTAVEVALKLALHAQQRLGRPQASRILTLAKSYHGDTVGAMSAAQQGLFTAPYAPYLFTADVLPRWPCTDFDEPLTDVEQSALTELEYKLKTGAYAAFIFEPLIQGAGGMRFIKKAYLDAVMSLCKQHQVFTIADEVMTGFYRTGARFAADQLAHAPDVACLSKALTGGFLPLGVTLAGPAIVDAFAGAPVAERFLHGHSFTANPLACRAALESLKLLEEPDGIAARANLAAAHKAFAGKLRAHPGVANVRTAGPILAFEVVTEERSGYLNTVKDDAYAWFLQRGLLIRPLGNTIYLLPPYTISADELNEAYAGILSWLDR